MTHQILDQNRLRLEARLEELIPPDASSLYAAARYSLLSPGKRLRPSLVLATGVTYGADLDASLDPACAIEMVHAYSLIHDDLPCMDDDDLRRGKPTLHKVFSEGIALLTGDYLLTYAFEIIGKAKALSMQQKLHLMQILSSAAGAEGMIGGQAADIEATKQQVDEAALIRMHQNKTGALLAAALQFGAVTGCAPPTVFPLLKDLGQKIGLAFQFLDDFLDATASKDFLGKNVKRDAVLQKSNAVQFYGAEKVKEKLQEFQIQIDQRLQLLPKRAPLIGELLQKYLWHRGDGQIS